MSRNFAVLGKAASPISLGPHSGNPAPLAAATVETASPSGEYFELIRLLFHSPAAVAIVGRCSDGSAESVTTVAANLAAELGASDKRVVVVPFQKLSRMNPIIIPDETAFIAGSASRVWLWPAEAGQKIEFFKSRESDHRGNWLDALRRNFDYVLFDCPDVKESPGVTELAAMADATVLAVEAGRTSRQQLQQDQQALQLRGARVVGCILIHGS